MQLILLLNMFQLDTTMEQKWDLGKSDLLDTHDILILQRMNKFLNCIVYKMFSLPSLGITPYHKLLVGLLS